MAKKKNGLGCLGLLLVLGVIGSFLGGNDASNKQSKPSVSQTMETVTPASDASEQEVEQVELEQSEKVKYDLTEMNIKISEWFNESVQFNQDGEDGYEWTVYVSDIKLKDNGVVNTDVTDEFKQLSDDDKTMVLNSVSRMVNAVVFLETEEDKPYFITAYDVNGDKVGQSKTLDVLEYEFE